MSLDDFAALSLDDGPPSDTITIITMGDIEDVAPSDLRLQCGTTVFEVHCAILAAASPVLRAMISDHASDDDASISMPEAASIMHAALRILYCDPTCLENIYDGHAHPANLHAFSVLADKYEMAGVTVVLHLAWVITGQRIPWGFSSGSNRPSFIFEWSRI
jgi:hypothetical protein